MSVNGQVLEAVVWDYVVGILTDPVFFETEWHKAQRKKQDLMPPRRERLEVVKYLPAHCEREAAETAEALKHARGPVLENLQAGMDSLDERYSKLTAERDRLIAALRDGSHLRDESLARTLQFRADIVDGPHDPTFDDMRLYLELLHVAVMVKDGQATIRCVLPVEPGEVNLSELRLTFIQYRA